MFTAPHTPKGTIAVLTLGAAVALTTAMAVSPTSAAPSDRSTASRGAIDTMVLAFPFQGGHQRFIDRGKKGISPGDLFLGTGLPILDNATGKRIGTGDSVELIVSARHDGTVTNQSTLRLPGGHVELDGVVRHTDHPFRTTVIGGTGRYLGVGGQLTLLRENTHRKVVVMKLELVR
jgi:hypothetical protein